MPSDTNTDTIRAIIAGALASDDYTLGLTVDEAREAMALIVESGAIDPEAMMAYDLLHSRATFGRAF